MGQRGIHVFALFDHFLSGNGRRKQKLEHFLVKICQIYHFLLKDLGKTTHHRGFKEVTDLLGTFPLKRKWSISRTLTGNGKSSNLESSSRRLLSKASELKKKRSWRKYARVTEVLERLLVQLGGITKFFLWSEAGCNKFLPVCNALEWWLL